MLNRYVQNLAVPAKKNRLNKSSNPEGATCRRTDGRRRDG